MEYNFYFSVCASQRQNKSFKKYIFLCSFPWCCLVRMEKGWINTRVFHETPGSCVRHTCDTTSTHPSYQYSEQSPRSLPMTFKYFSTHIIDERNFKQRAKKIIQFEMNFNEHYQRQIVDQLKLSVYTQIWIGAVIVPETSDDTMKYLWFSLYDWWH